MTEIEALEQRAVDAAIAHEWEKAVELNKQILAEDSENIGASLRLGFAHLQLEHISEAKKFYKQALKIQPKNPVALENLDRITILEEMGSKNPIKARAILDPSLFLEIPGKTKTVSLVNLGQKTHIAELDFGEKVELKLKRRKIEVRTADGNYVGYLPDDISKRLIFFIEAHSTYAAHVKEANANKVVIFIKEEKKGPKVAHYSSFPANPTILPNIPHDVEETEPEDETGEGAEWEIGGAGEIEEEQKEHFDVNQDEDSDEEEE